MSLFACLVVDAPIDQLVAVARAFSPRVEAQAGAVLLDVSGLGRIVGDPPVVGRELMREARERGLPVRIAVAGTRTAALLLARAVEGVRVVEPGQERAAVAEVPISVLASLASAQSIQTQGTQGTQGSKRKTNPCGLCALCGERGVCAHLPTLRRWGLRTLGDLAALAPASLFERLGAAGLALHRVASGRDDRPLVARIDPARFDASMDLDWPIETLEPLSFVLARLLDPLSQALERADRSAAAIEVRLTLVTREVERRRLELPAPMRDARTLRTLVALHLEAHPVAAAIDRVAILLEPAPARIVQFSLLERALPSPETLSTLVARLDALMGAGRVGAPALVDSHEPGAFELRNVDCGLWIAGRPAVGTAGTENPQSTIPNPQFVLRRFRLPVPARVEMQGGRPVRVTTMRRGIAGGRVEQYAGPWRSSGGWWTACRGFEQNAATTAPSKSEARRALGVGPQREGEEAVGPRRGWNNDEWDVALPDGVYRVCRDRASGHWFLEGVLD